MDNSEEIIYSDCPHFTVGRVDQWGENGFLLFHGSVYRYEEDRKEQTGQTSSPRSIDDFLNYAAEQQIEIPDDFREQLNDLQAAEALLKMGPEQRIH